MAIYNKIDTVEQEIKRKEALAKDAKKKGMKTTYGNYMLELVLLKSQLEKLRTDAGRR